MAPPIEYYWPIAVRANSFNTIRSFEVIRGLPHWLICT